MHIDLALEEKHAHFKIGAFQDIVFSNLLSRLNPSVDSTGPGATLTTLTPLGPHSTAWCFERVSGKKKIVLFCHKGYAVIKYPQLCYD